MADDWTEMIESVTSEEEERKDEETSPLKMKLEGEEVPEDLRGKTVEEVLALTKKLADEFAKLKKVVSEEVKKEEEKEEAGEEKVEERKEGATPPMMKTLVGLALEQAVEKVVAGDEILGKYKDEIKKYLQTAPPDRLLDPEVISTVRAVVRGNHLEEFLEAKMAAERRTENLSSDVHAGGKEPTTEEKLRLPEGANADVLEEIYGSGHVRELRVTLKGE